MNAVGTIIAVGGLAVLVVAYLATRRGSSNTTIGNVGSTFVLPFSSSLASVESPIAAAAATPPAASSPNGNYGAFNRYGNKP